MTNRNSENSQEPASSAADNSSSTKQFWRGILETLTPESRFLGLVALVVEAILAFSLFRFETENYKIIVVAIMAAILIAAVVAAVVQFWIAHPKVGITGDKLVIPARKEGTVGNETSATRFDYHVFVATAMAAISDGLRNERAASIEAVTNAICEAQKDTDVRIFNAGAKISDQSDFDDPAIALAKNIERMRASKYLALFYFENVPTSALIEVGMALSLGKDNVWFVKQGIDVPYLMKGQPIASQYLPNVRIVSFRDEKDLVRLVKDNADKYFPS